MPRDITEPPYKHSETLFTKNSRPLHFYMRPCKERRKLKEMIEHGGGIIDGNISPNCIRLAAGGFFVGTHESVSTDFVIRSVHLNKTLDTADFVLKTPVDGGQTTSFDEENEFDRVPAKPKGKQKKPRNNFTHREDEAMLAYMEKHNKIDECSGYNIYKEMLDKKVITGHTAMSLNNRFRKTIMHQLEKYTSVSEKFKARLLSVCGVSAKNPIKRAVVKNGSADSDTTQTIEESDEEDTLVLPRISSTRAKTLDRFRPNVKTYKPLVEQNEPSKVPKKERRAAVPALGDSPPSTRITRNISIKGHCTNASTRGSNDAVGKNTHPSLDGEFQTPSRKTKAVGDLSANESVSTRTDGPTLRRHLKKDISDPQHRSSVAVSDKTDLPQRNTSDQMDPSERMTRESSEDEQTPVARRSLRSTPSFNVQKRNGLRKSQLYSSKAQSTKSNKKNSDNNSTAEDTDCVVLTIETRRSVRQSAFQRSVQLKTPCRKAQDDHDLSKNETSLKTGGSVLKRSPRKAISDAEPQSEEASSNKIDLPRRNLSGQFESPRKGTRVSARHEQNTASEKSVSPAKVQPPSSVSRSSLRSTSANNEAKHNGLRENRLSLRKPQSITGNTKISNKKGSAEAGDHSDETLETRPSVKQFKPDTVDKKIDSSDKTDTNALSDSDSSKPVVSPPTTRSAAAKNPKSIPQNPNKPLKKDATDSRTRNLDVTSPPIRNLRDRNGTKRNIQRKTEDSSGKTSSRDSSSSDNEGEDSSENSEYVSTDSHRMSHAADVIKWYSSCTVEPLLKRSSRNKVAKQTVTRVATTSSSASSRRSSSEESEVENSSVRNSARNSDSVSGSNSDSPPATRSASAKNKRTRSSTRNQTKASKKDAVGSRTLPRRSVRDRTQRMLQSSDSDLGDFVTSDEDSSKSSQSSPAKSHLRSPAATPNKRCSRSKAEPALKRSSRGITADQNATRVYTNSSSNEESDAESSPRKTPSKDSGRSLRVSSRGSESGTMRNSKRLSKADTNTSEDADLHDERPSTRSSQRQPVSRRLQDNVEEVKETAPPSSDSESSLYSPSWSPYFPRKKKSTIPELIPSDLPEPRVHLTRTDHESLPRKDKLHDTPGKTARTPKRARNATEITNGNESNSKGLYPPAKPNNGDTLKDLKTPSPFRKTYPLRKRVSDEFKNPESARKRQRVSYDGTSTDEPGEADSGWNSDASTVVRVSPATRVYRYRSSDEESHQISSVNAKTGMRPVTAKNQEGLASPKSKASKGKAREGKQLAPTKHVLTLIPLTEERVQAKRPQVNGNVQAVSRKLVLDVVSNDSKSTSPPESTATSPLTDGHEDQPPTEKTPRIASNKSQITPLEKLVVTLATKEELKKIQSPTYEPPCVSSFGNLEGSNELPGDKSCSSGRLNGVPKASDVGDSPCSSMLGLPRAIFERVLGSAVNSCETGGKPSFGDSVLIIQWLSEVLHLPPAHLLQLIKNDEKNSEMPQTS